MTIMGESAGSALVFPHILNPIFAQLECRDPKTSQSLRIAIYNFEKNNPGFCYDLILAIIRKAELNVNLNEVILRLQGIDEYRLLRTEETFQELNKKSLALKVILSRIPDEISDRKTFLETIKEIASAIKKLLDVVNEVGSFIPGLAAKQEVEQRKKEFVKYSKRFSTTLKEYFKEGQTNAVFLSALALIRQTNQIMLTIKNKCE